MKQKISQNSKTVQNLKHKAKSKPGQSVDPDEGWSFIEDEPDLVQFQHEYEFAPEHRFFN